MYEVDARGLSCPEPLMLAQDALKKHSGPVTVFVSEVSQRDNIENYAKKMGKNVTVTEKDSDFQMVIE